VLQRIEGLLDGKWVAMAATAVSLALLLALIATWVRYARLREILEAGGLSEPDASRPGGPARSEGLQRGSGTLMERLLPRRLPAFLLLVAALTAGSWALGYALAPNTQRFLASPEWQFQPLYLAAHLLTLRLFIAVFTRNFAAGAARLDMPPERGKAGFSVILGPAGALLALVVAVPFCIWDYGYLHSPGYERMGDELGAVDLAMWGIWCVEWFLNAVIWVVLTGFLIMNVRAIGTYRFRDPIEVALSEKHYRPFLQMSSQGATIVLGFAALTVAYIWYTGGAETAYIGLLIVAVLLVAGFVPPWWLINRNVDRSITEEVAALRRSLVGIAPAAGQGDPRPPRNLETRLEEALVLLRIQRLEGMRRGLGWTEARAMGVRLLAPAATVAWNLSANVSEAIVRAGQAMRHLLGAVARLFGG